jgi:UDP-2,3-diacylglucosamine pyrophosphatase LpxH
MSQGSEATRFIISDLHLGKNDDFDIFKADGKEQAFELFLKFCAGHEGPVELVINGDFVDFLQLEPWNAYSVPPGGKQSFVKDAAVKKAGEIAIAHARVFGALGTFLSDTKNRLVILLGNHDVELAYKEVWTVIHDAIAGAAAVGDRIDFINRATQYNFRLGGVLCHVEHGNIGDQWNEIAYTQLFNNAEKNSGFDYPAGTLFVYDIMNTFKKRFRFVDVLKPEIPAVPLVLAQLEPLSTAKTVPKIARAKLSALKNGFVGYLQGILGGGAFGPGADRDAEQEACFAMANRYAGEVRKSGTFDELSVSHVEDFLSERQTESAAASEPGFGKRWDKVKRYLANTVLDYLGRPADPNDKSFFQQDQTGDDVTLAIKRFEGDVKVVVFGHTHAALKAEIPGKGVYLNSGTWANLLALPSDASNYSVWLDGIFNNSFKPLIFPTYVRLAPREGGLEASLNYWSAGGEDVLWKTHTLA